MLSFSNRVKCCLVPVQNINNSNYKLAAERSLNERTMKIQDRLLSETHNNPHY